jgi:hypothetical protein
MNVREVATKPYNDQKPGTAGLRKKVAVFQQPHYLENFLQAIFDVDSRLAGARLVIGGDGRYHNREAIQTALRIAAANGVKHAIVGQGGLLSTPAASHAIRRHNAAGGFLFTASHNPAGPDGDFGIKFNVAGGGQASESITGRIYEVSRTISRYRIVDAEPVDLDRRGSSRLGDMEVEIIDCVDDYAALMQQLFDFDQIRSWFRAGHRIRFDAMHAVTGPYARRIFIDLLGAPEDSLQNAIPLEDFGGGHPDPNLIYAKHLVDVMYGPDAPDFGAASDGDGDRNMIVGRGMFVSPGDSLAMLAAHLHRLPGYKGGLVGVARSMPTCRAVDKVAAAIAKAAPEGARGSVKYDGTRSRFEVLFQSTVQPEGFVAGEFFRVGVHVTTGDTGGNSVIVRAVVWQHLCLNLIVIDQCSLPVASLRHIGTVMELRRKFEGAFNKALKAINPFMVAWGYARQDDVVERARGTTEAPIPTDPREAVRGIFAGLLEREAVTFKGKKPGEVLDALVAAWEKDESSAVTATRTSRAAIVNAVTRAAHEWSLDDPWAEDELQREAGALLWGRKGRPPAPLTYLDPEVLLTKPAADEGAAT